MKRWQVLFHYTNYKDDSTNSNLSDYYFNILTGQKRHVTELKSVWPVNTTGNYSKIILSPVIYLISTTILQFISIFHMQEDFKPLWSVNNGWKPWFNCLEKWIRNFRKAYIEALPGGIPCRLSKFKNVPCRCFIALPVVVGS